MPKVNSYIYFKHPNACKILKGKITDKYMETFINCFGQRVKRMMYEVQVPIMDDRDDLNEEFYVARNSCNDGYIAVEYDAYYKGWVGYDI